jgi:hypothetical protein
MGLRGQLVFRHQKTENTRKTEKLKNWQTHVWHGFEGTASFPTPKMEKK